MKDGRRAGGKKAANRVRPAIGLLSRPYNRHKRAMVTAPGNIL